MEEITENKEWYQSIRDTGYNTSELLPEEVEKVSRALNLVFPS